ncbi:nucleotidyltransferase family protein [Paenibacillus flagellatus]|nr:nucleotidyltransferase family protein [Paenibacillus flagellatus]
MKALLLAAGYATRLYPLTLDKPKALLPVGSKTIIDRIVDQLERIRPITAIVVVTNNKFADRFRQWRDGRGASVPISIVDDGTASDADKLGAIGDIRLAVERAGIDDDLLVIAGDNVFTFDLGRYVDYFYRVERDCIVVRTVDRLEELKRVGVVELNGDGRVVSFEEKPANPRSNVGAFALYAYRRDTIPLFADYLSEGNDPDAPGHFPAWLCRRKDVRAYFADGAVYDVGTPEAYEEARRAFGPGDEQLDRRSED